MDIPKRPILKSDFTVAALQNLTGEAARQYFLMHYFVPLAYNHSEQYLNNRDGFNAIVLCITHTTTKTAAPVLMPATISGQNANWQDLTPGEVHDVQLTFQETIKKTFNIVPNPAELGPVLYQIFDGCFWVGGYAYMGNQPMVACFACKDSKLHITVKPRSKYPNDAQFCNKSVSQDGAIILSNRGRFFNSLTGEWVGMCKKDAADCCVVCQSIYASPVANNYYGGNHNN